MEHFKYSSQKKHPEQYFTNYINNPAALVAGAVRTCRQLFGWLGAGFCLCRWKIHITTEDPLILDTP